MHRQGTLHNIQSTCICPPFLQKFATQLGKNVANKSVPTQIRKDRTFGTRVATAFLSEILQRPSDFDEICDFLIEFGNVGAGEPLYLGAGTPTIVPKSQ